MGGVRATGLTVVCVLAFGAAPASAGTVFVAPGTDGQSVVRYIGAPGERSEGSLHNDIDFESDEFLVTVADRVGSLTLDGSATARCRNLLIRVECRFPASGPQPAGYADLRDGNDVFEAATTHALQTGGYASVEVQGGGGNDRLNSASTGVVFRGGTGSDRFTLDNANPYATGFCPACPPGSEPPIGTTIGTVSYADHPNGVTVSVDAYANDGYAGEGDYVQPGLNVLGSPGGDVMRNDDVFDWYGSLDGAAGNDTLWGKGPDGPLLGGGGDDDIHTRDSYRDDVDCGTGSDLLVGDPSDSHRDCELLDIAAAPGP